MTKKKKQPKPLKGSDLIAKVKQLGDLTREEKAKACGYVKTEKDGSERIKLIAFLNALLEAEGVDLDTPSNRYLTGGRKASYRVCVQSNGNVLVGSAYTKAMDVQPGEEFQISLGRKHIHLKLVTDRA